MTRIAAAAAAAAAAVAEDAAQEQEQPAQIAAAAVDSGWKSKRSHGEAAAPQAFAAAAAAADSSLKPSKRCRRGATLHNVAAMPTRTAQLPFGVAAEESCDAQCRLFISPDRAWATEAAVLGAVERAVLMEAAAQAAEALME
jgi:hypothetical protein